MSPRPHIRLHAQIGGANPPAQCRGFSLIEVMVALVVSAIGLLGLAKMESLAISSTSVASARALAAIQAESLAAAMHANTGYWAASTVPTSTTVTVTVTGTPQIVSTDGSLATAVASCSGTGSGSCAPNVMAAYDLQQWAGALQTLLPGSFSTITCTNTDLTPITCTIQIQWTEKAIAANAQQTNISALQAPTYILYVQP
jgi:type IV pilus assembly protein PilV